MGCKPCLRCDGVSWRLSTATARLVPPVDGALSLLGRLGSPSLGVIAINMVLHAARVHRFAAKPLLLFFGRPRPRPRARPDPCMLGKRMKLLAATAAHNHCKAFGFSPPSFPPASCAQGRWLHRHALASGLPVSTAPVLQSDHMLAASI